MIRKHQAPWQQHNTGSQLVKCRAAMGSRPRRSMAERTESHTRSLSCDILRLGFSSRSAGSISASYALYACRHSVYRIDSASWHSVYRIDSRMLRWIGDGLESSQGAGGARTGKQRWRSPIDWHMCSVGDSRYRFHSLLGVLVLLAHRETVQGLIEPVCCQHSTLHYAIAEPTCARAYH